MKKKLRMLLLLLMGGVGNLIGANTKTTVTQVTNSVTVSSDVDYVITGSTPFSTAGSVNISSTEHAVVIIQNIKPSVVIKNWLSHVYIKGAKAVDGTNCQVKMYSHGAIILPYSSDFKPLTCYTQPGFAGTSCNTYSEGHDGGFMKTLDSSNLNNRIRSFKLKRGYMVTFALGTGGWGYSRCFIADQADLEISNLPANMDARISSYRLFKWQNAKKAGLASDTSFGANDALNSSWCYSWGTGENRYPDTECVPNHIYEDWPSPAACGSVDYSCHMKTNNEPGNSADDHPQDVATVLDNWQNLMRTGMRLCSESSHDGSMNHLKAFIDSIDARGWRCDLLDLHCYWPSGTFNSLTWYSDYYGNGRPVWISEWVWGASWNNNGIFSAAPDGRNSFSSANQKACYDGTKPLLDILNSNSRIERYAYWNSEVDASKIYRGGTLSTLGSYYANMNDGLGYNASNEFVPRVVTRAPQNFIGTYSSAQGTCVLEWDDPNGDMVDSVVVEAKLPGKVSFKRLAAVAVKDMNAKTGASYTYTAMISEKGSYSFRVAVYPVGSTSPVRTGVVNVITPGGDSFADVTSQYVSNASFDNTGSIIKSNLANGEGNHLNIAGWTTTNNSAFGCSSAVALGSAYTVNGVAAPATDMDGKTSGAVLGFSQGWTTQAVYTQNVNLPAGSYRMSYNVYNAQNALSFTNNTGVIIDGKAVYGKLNTVQVGRWRNESIEFSLDDAKTVTLSVGYTCPATTSSASPFLFFDNIKLEKDMGYGEGAIAGHNYMIHWDGDGETGSGSEPSNFGWSSSNSRSWNVANSSGARYEDYGVSGGFSGYTTEDGKAWTQRVLWIRFGNNETYTYRLAAPLANGNSYKFSGLVGWNSNGDPNSKVTIDVYCGSTKYATKSVVTATAKRMYAVEAEFDVPANETVTDWKIVISNSCNNKDQIIALSDLKMECTSAAEPVFVDYSSKIANASYSSNNNNGWSGTSVTAVSYNCAEQYNKTFDYYQTITGLPAGTYRVGVQAFYRAGYADNDYSTVNNAAYSNAVLYATGNGETKTVAVRRASSEASASTLGGSESAVGNAYIPNNMQAASIYFAADKYHNYLEVNVGTDGRLTIGIRKNTTIGGDWTIFDNWTLEKIEYETAPEPEDMTDAIANASYSSNNNNGWSGTSVTAVSYNCAEQYNKTFDYYQTITGLPAGNYRVGVQAFYRAGYADNDYSTVNNAAYSNAVLYATGNGETKTVAVRRASSEASASKLGGSESAVGSAYIPNNMQAASIYFAAGKYNNYVDVIVGADGRLTIGIRKNTTIGGDWTIFDNWTLTYNPSAQIRSRMIDDGEVTEIETMEIADSVLPVDYITPDGQIHDAPVKGLNIVRMSDGSVRKIMVK